MDDAGVQKHTAGVFPWPASRSAEWGQMTALLQSLPFWGCRYMAQNSFPVPCTSPQLGLPSKPSSEGCPLV